MFRNELGVIMVNKVQTIGRNLEMKSKMKTIFLTGATDGIGLLTAKKFAALGHSLLLHGRSPEKMKRVVDELSTEFPNVTIKSYNADLSDFRAIKAMAADVLANQKTIDVLINNAGILKTSNTITADGLDIRFVVNMLAPYYLTHKLLPLIPENGRVLNLSSAAQNPVNLDALNGKVGLNDMEAYAQSKLAITMWSRILGNDLENGPRVYSVNPGSLLGTNMVKGGFGIAGNDVNIGADILVRLSLEDESDVPSGSYYDNDAGQFGSPHTDALNDEKSAAVVTACKELVTRFT